MQLNYNSTNSDHSYMGRIFLFAKRNLWLFLLDLLVIIFLVLPPYSWNETRILILFIIILLIRDIVILKLCIRHLGQFEAKGNDIIIKILKRNKIKLEIKEWLPDLELEIKYFLGIPIMYISKGNDVIFKQYPTGIWSAAKMREFINSFYDYKKVQNLWKMYKGQE